MTSTVFDSTIFQDLYSTPATRQIFSDENLVDTYLLVERTLAQVQADLDIIPQAAADVIAEKARRENLDWARFAEAVPNAGVPIPALVAQLVAAVGDEGEWVHYGATTQDIMDTALVLQLRDVIAVVEGDLDAIQQLLSELATRYRDTPMVGRSQLQQALPITFGYKLATWLSAIQRHAERLQQLKPRLLVGQFSGAVGTLASLGTQGLSVQANLCAALGLGQPQISWHTMRDCVAEFATFLALLSGTLGKMGFDIALMAQTEVGELAEPALPGRGGSSTMPHKRNPISAQRMLVAARLVKQHASSMLEAQINDHERGAGIWPMEWAALPQACLLTGVSLAQTRFVLDGLQVNKERMAQNLALTDGLLLSEAVMMALAPKIGRKTAHSLLKEIVAQAVESKQSLGDVLKQNETVMGCLDSAEIDSLMNPANYVGLAGEMVDRVLSGL